LAKIVQGDKKNRVIEVKAKADYFLRGKEGSKGSEKTPRDQQPTILSGSGRKLKNT